MLPSLLEILAKRRMWQINPGASLSPKQPPNFRLHYDPFALDLNAPRPLVNVLAFWKGWDGPLGSETEELLRNFARKQKGSVVCELHKP